MKNKIAALLLGLCAAAPPMLAYAHDHLFPVSVDNKWGYIDEKGNMIVEPKYDLAGQFYGRPYAAISVSGKWGLIDLQGRPVISAKYDDLAYSFAPPFAVRVGPKWGYVDAREHQVIPLKFEEADSFGSDLARVKLGGQYGFVDRSGASRIKPQFEDAGPFAYGLAPAKLHGRWIYIDVNGHIKINKTFEEAGFFVSGLAPIKRKGKWGYIDTKGREVLKPVLDEAPEFLHGAISSRYLRTLVQITYKGKPGYVSTRGKLMLFPQYELVQDFAANGLAPVSVKGKFGFIDVTGKLVIEPRFDAVSGFSDNGLAPARIGSFWGYIDAKGDFTIKPQFNEAIPFNDDGLAQVHRDRPGGDGYIDDHGDWIAMPIIGCGTAVVYGKNHLPIWIPKTHRAIPDIADCVLWSDALGGMDAESAKALLTHGYRPREIDKDLSQVARTTIDSSPDSQEMSRAKGQLSIVKLLLDHGANPNYVDPRFSGSALASAIMGGRTEAGVALINGGALVDESLIVDAVRSGNHQILQAMFAKRANLNSVGKDGQTALGYVLKYQPLDIRKICRGNPDGSDNCVDAKPENFDRFDLARQLLEHGADANKPTNGVPPITLTQQNDTKLIQLLLDHGAKLSGTFGKRNFGAGDIEIGPITWSIDQERSDIFKLAIAQAGRKLARNEKYAIMLAVEMNKSQLVHELLELGADPNLTVGREPATLLDVAEMRGDSEVVNELRKAGGHHSLGWAILYQFMKGSSFH